MWRSTRYIDLGGVLATLVSIVQPALQCTHQKWGVNNDVNKVASVYVVGHARKRTPVIFPIHHTIGPWFNRVRLTTFMEFHITGRT
jgi:hypothetical protein